MLRHLPLLLTLLVSTAATAQPEPGTATQGPLSQRLDWEERSLDNPFTLISHKPTYILPLSYNSSPSLATTTPSEPRPERIEMKFQISLKFLVWPNLVGKRGHLFFAYTQQSYWQAFQHDNSSPFRETVHEPEAILFLPSQRELFGFRNPVNLIGLSHQSNGRSEPQSRSWNRLYIDFILTRGDLAVSIKPWWRIPERSADDDNPDIEDYLGHGELGLIYKLGKHTLASTLRHSLDSAKGRGAVQLDWSFPIYHDRLNGYIQYFNGYGESLIDYNDSGNRIGLGLILTDWL